MKKKYMIKVVNDTDEVRPVIQHGDIIELEEVEEVKKETLESRLSSINRRLGDLEAKSGRASKSDVKDLAEYVKRQTDGLVRIEDVLKVLEKTWNSWICINTNEYNFYLYARKSIEGMKK